MSTSEFLTVADMTVEAQIERLVRQRNALWRLVNDFGLEHGHHEKTSEEEAAEDVVDEVTTTVSHDDDGKLHLTINVPLDRLLELGRHATRLLDEVDKIMDNTYAIEGAHPLNDDVDPQCTGPAFAPYMAALGSP